ncbi:MAG: cyclase family protein [Chloroflexi bacterium]|nr:cyclase family protein [Chloroflexota bacterium]
MASQTEIVPQAKGNPQAIGWTEISVPLFDGMVHWPGDPPVRIQRTADIDLGDSHTLSEISMGSHSGTHIDAPRHFLRQGLGIDRMPAEATVGIARVIEIRDTVLVRAEELLAHRIRRGERILLKTRNSGAAWWIKEFTGDFVSISLEAADFLARRGVRAVGIDYLSIGGYRADGKKVHQVLLEAGIWLIEGLDLSRVSQGKYHLVCLPLRLKEGDGAPARAFVRRA